MLLNNNMFIKIFMPFLIFMIFSVNIISSNEILMTGRSVDNYIETPLPESSNNESSIVTFIDGIYYMRGYDPKDIPDIGSLLRAQPEENEHTVCGMFVNFHFVQEGNYSGINEINNIYYHFWQKSEFLFDFLLGYSTSSLHTAGFNESIYINLNDYICEVNNYLLLRAMQYTDPEIAVFEDDEIYEFTVKYFGSNPNILCNPDQYSFLILNLEDNDTLIQYDRDHDLLSDYIELFEYYTNPFDMDTDNDGATDYDEVMGDLFGFTSSNPNDFNDTTEFRQLYALVGGPYTGLENEIIQFYGEAFGGVSPYTWQWDFGDGNFSNKKNPTHKYRKAGNYSITLTVTDDVEESSYESTIVSVDKISINFLKPENAIYIGNRRIVPFFIPIIIGGINLEVETSSEISEIKKVEFYVNDGLRLIDEESPYEWQWREISFNKNEIKINVFNDNDNNISEEKVIWKYF